MGEVLGRASVQYSDWRGTAAMDDRMNAQISRFLAGDGDAPAGFVVAFDIYRGESESTFLSIYVVEGAGSYDEIKSLADKSGGSVDVVRYSVENPPGIDDFLHEMAKRFQLRMMRRSYEDIDFIADET